MKKLLFCIIPLLVLMGCASGRKPAAQAAGTPAVKNVVNPHGIDLDAAIKEAAAQMGENLPVNTEVALVSVASSSAQLSEYVISRLEAALVSGRKLVVVDRANLDKIREEQGFQLSGEVDDNSAKEIGKILGAGAIVTGSFINLGDVYGLSLKAINMKTAAIAVSYPADITKSTRIETLLASGGGSTGTGTRTAQTPRATSATAAAAVPPAPTAPAPAVPAAPVQRNSNDPSYKVGDKGPGGGLIFYETDVSYSAPPPVNREYQSGQNGPAGGLVFYPAAHVQTPPKVDRAYQIGETGPAGGIIFYINPQAGDWKYLEAAPASAEFSRNWGLSGKTVRTDVTTGAGQQNTKTIAAALENNGEIGAALLCVDLTAGGYKDWFLPSKAELNLMYRNLALKSLGSFKSNLYWSSSAADNNYAWMQDFSDGSQKSAWNGRDGGADKQTTRLVRAVRQF
ncbi:hypothetical protein FACS1894190_00400 [Spirochaetia bacterium]|nr:hypothetical protein FACS1894190_00400 [Spirochaetia bacterium]